MNRLIPGLLAPLLLAAPLSAAAPPVPASRAPEKPLDTSPVVRGNTQLALELYARLGQKEGNLFFSPFSISSALSMTSAGARGKTLEQMQGALHLVEQEKLHPANALLLRQLNDPGRKGYTLSVANALWGQKGYPFLREFVALNKQYYGAGLNEIDFAEDPEAARKTINGWVEKQTHDKIKELLGRGVVERDTRLVLTNAVYFKGEWSRPFKKDRTREDTFFAPGKPVEGVPFMHQTGRLNLLEEKGVQVLELPFAGDDLSMVLLVPTRKDGLADLEKNLSPEKLGGWLGKLTVQPVDVILPRFRVTAEFDLKAPLRELGMHDAFNEARADFSGIDGKRWLFVSDVVHKARIEVDEQGATAAGSTGVVIKPRSPDGFPTVRADHPFLFLIRDKKTESILFLGRLASPVK